MSHLRVCFEKRKKTSSRKRSSKFSTAKQVNMLTKSAPDFEANAEDFLGFLW